jgi:acyl carrier protein
MLSNEQTLKEVVARVFRIDAAHVTPDTSAETVETWDSLNHLNLMLALESAFDVRIPAVAFSEMLSYPQIRSTLARCGVQFS